MAKQANHLNLIAGTDTTESFYPTANFQVQAVKTTIAEDYVVEQCPSQLEGNDEAWEMTPPTMANQLDQTNKVRPYNYVKGWKYRIRRVDNAATEEDVDFYWGVTTIQPYSRG